MVEKIIRQSNCFTLSARRIRNLKKRGKGHIQYTIRTNWWVFDDAEEERVRDMIDPSRNISGRRATSWTFKRLEDAEKNYTMLILKWA